MKNYLILFTLRLIYLCTVYTHVSIEKQDKIISY